LSGVEDRIRRGEWINPEAGKVLFKDYAEEWRESQAHRPSTAAQVETNLRLHVYPRIGHRPLVSIQRSDVQALVKYLSTAGGERRALAPATVEVVYTWVSTIFTSAVADRIINVTPCRSISRTVVEQPKVEPLPVETVWRLIDAVPDRYRALIILGAGTGVRISEALGLTNDRVDWIRKSVKIDRQLLRVGGGAPVFGPVKDKNNRPRTIPLPDFVVEELSAHVSKYNLGAEGLIFSGPNGGPLPRSTFSDMWRAAAEPLGIAKGDGFHLLRHFYASLLIESGQSVKSIQERLGHQSAVITLDVYGHLWPEGEDLTRTAVDDAFAKLRAHSAHA
jgi:integrase